MSSLASADKQRAVLLALFQQCKLPPALSWNDHTPLEKWNGIYLDYFGEVLKIDVRGGAAGGDDKIVGRLSPAWDRLDELLPRAKFIDLSDNLINNHSLNMAHLPHELEFLSFRGNALSGSLDLSSLPESLRFLYLQSNRLGGKYDLRPGACGGHAEIKIVLDGNPAAVVLGGGAQSAKSFDLSGWWLLVFIPAVIMLVLLAIAPVIAANSDSLSHSVCQQHLNGTCASFFDSCSTSTQVTALPPHDMLCPLSTKCCVAGNDNFFLARAAAGDTNNTFFYSSSNDDDDDGNETATTTHQSSFNYFLSPPIDYIDSEVLKGDSDVDKALAQLCGKMADSTVPPDAMWMLLGGVLSVISSIFLNLLAGTACYMRLSAAVGARLARCCRCACPALCFRKCCEDDTAAADEHAILSSSEKHISGAPPAANYGTTQVDIPKNSVENDEDDDDDNDDGDNHLPVLSSASRFFHLSRGRRQKALTTNSGNVSFVRRCFTPTGLLGWKSLCFLLAAVADVVYTVRFREPKNEEVTWQANAAVTILVNGSFLKGGFDVLLVSWVSLNYDLLMNIDQRLFNAESFAEAASSLVDGAAFFLLSVPLAALQTAFSVRKQELPAMIRRYVRIFCVAFVPLFFVFVLPGIALFLPLIAALAGMIFAGTFVVIFLSWLRLQCLKGSRNFRLENKHWRERVRVTSEMWRPDSVADNIFHFLRMALVIIMCNILCNYLIAMPANMMTLVFSHGATYLHGSGYARTLFDELAVRSESCYYLQTYVSGIHSFQTFLRLF